ncbi:uncharacterized protein JN550_004371 [Neoarthrinium moseri]|uniref:uncharacterized protein n=1 Tax=Neoarthrinium moseri TaxID=1658444 RepID=UPI001FDB305A|nr:uncharacterized protein JN550_004371 [Neoarthrinium moseri]KAI1871377.1 hypothetical protein JN550_004371 [Neoarthrinium moseri]
MVTRIGAASMRAIGAERRYCSGRTRLHRHNYEPKRIAVIGGGITGLSTAYYAAQKFPSAEITIFESTSRLGGVIESKPISVSGPSPGSFLCEVGPRTLRANAPRAVVTCELIHLLGLTDKLLKVPKDSPAAGTRYIMYPKRLVALPASDSVLIRRHIASIPAPTTFGMFRLLRIAWLAVTQPLFHGALSGVLQDMFIARRPGRLLDESIGHFVSRRWHPSLADNFLSAVMHGLYAGDIYQLSMKALMPKMWSLELAAEAHRIRMGPLLGSGGILRAMICAGDPRHRESDGRPATGESASLEAHRREHSMLDHLQNGISAELQQDLQKTSVFSFEGGIETLVDALGSGLKRYPKVDIQLGSKVTHISTRNDAIKIQVNDGIPQEFDSVIATIPFRLLKSLIPWQRSLSSLAAPAVTVMGKTLVSVRGPKSRLSLAAIGGKANWKINYRAAIKDWKWHVKSWLVILEYVQNLRLHV